MLEPKGIALLAGGASKLDAPFDDPKWTLWTMNDFYYQLPITLKRRTISFSALFEMHPPSHYNTSVIYIKDHEKQMADLAARGLHVWLAFKNRKIPKGRIYPLKQVIHYFKVDYFCSTLAYMIPMAIMQMEAKDSPFAKRLGLWGADMQLTSEYARERACVEFWLGRAMDRGIEVVIPVSSPLLKGLFRYGYDTEKLTAQHLLINGRRQELAAMVADLDAQEGRIHEQKQELRGALSETGWVESHLTDTHAPTQAMGIAQT